MKSFDIFRRIGSGCLAALLLLIGSASLQAQSVATREVVSNVQEALVEHGFEPGPIDGLMGPRTRSALVLFQKEAGLEANGRLTNKTLVALGLKEEDPSLLEQAGGTVKAGGKAVGKAAATAGKATADAAETAGKATAKAGVTAAKATAEGATKAGEATVKGVSTAKDATVSGVSTAGRATRDFLRGGPEGEELAERVRVQLDEDPRIDLSLIEVVAEKQDITLYFKEGTQEEMDRAVEVAKQVKGVEKVLVRKKEMNY